MANLTLSIDDELLQRARETAVCEKTSVNALVREYLERYVNLHSRQAKALEEFCRIADSTESYITSNWTRESLHERKDS